MNKKYKNTLKKIDIHLRLQYTITIDNMQAELIVKVIN